MSVPQSHDAQLGEQHLEEQDDKIHQEEASEMDRMNTGGEVPEILKPKKKRERKEPVTLERELGKSLFPISRVQKIIRADKEIPVMAKDATFLISLATEEFIKRLTEAGQQIAHREKRATVQHKDIATVVRKADEFLFLEEIMPWTSSDPPAKRAKPKGTGLSASGPTLLDQFVVNKTAREEVVGREDVVMNEDGTMYAAGSPSFEHDFE